MYLNDPHNSHPTPNKF